MYVAVKVFGTPPTQTVLGSGCTLIDAAGKMFTVAICDTAEQPDVDWVSCT